MASTGRIAPQARQGSNSRNLDPRIVVGVAQSGATAAVLKPPQLIGAANYQSGALLIGNGTALNLSTSAYSGQAYGDSILIGQSYATAAPSISIGASDPGRNWGVNAQYGIAIGVSSWVNSSGIRAVAIGYLARGNASNAVAVGSSVTASGNGAVAVGNSTSGTQTGDVGIGTGSSASGGFSVAIGYVADAAGGSGVAIGYQTTASFAASTGIGYRARPEMQAETRISSGGSFSGFSELASSMIVGYMQTTNATPTEIGLGNAANSATPTGRIILSNISSYVFNIDIVAQVNGGSSDSAMWNLTFGIQRGANAAATALVGTPILTVIGNTAGAAAWTVAVTADTTNGRPSIKVTGAATTINWVMTARMTKIGV